MFCCMESDDDDHLEFKQITLNRDEKVKGCDDAIEASMLEESFSAYQDAYVESPFRPCNVLSATQRRAEMKQRLPLFGPSNEATFSVPEDCPGIYFKRFSSDGRVRRRRRRRRGSSFALRLFLLTSLVSLRLWQ